MSKFFDLSADHRLIVKGKPFSGSQEDLSALAHENIREWRRFVSEHTPKWSVTGDGIIEIRLT